MTPEQTQWFDKWDAENCAADNAQFTVGHVARDYARKAVEAALSDLPAMLATERERCCGAIKELERGSEGLPVDDCYVTFGDAIQAIRSLPPTDALEEHDRALQIALLERIMLSSDPRCLEKTLAELKRGK